MPTSHLPIPEVHLPGLCQPMIEENASPGTWVGQSVKHSTLDFGSGHDLTVHGFEPLIGLHLDSAELAWDSLSLCPSPLVHKLSRSLSK